MENQSNRNRPIQLSLWVSKKERSMIEKRMAAIGVMNFGAFARKMMIDGYIVNLDLGEVKSLVKQLRYYSNNVNQIAKRANATDSIYKTDIERMQHQLDELWNMMREILKSLSKIS